jgi:hypothetical protein
VLRLLAVPDLAGLAASGMPIVVTGHGWHLWYQATGHHNRVTLLPAVDWRGVGGTAVAPPSRHVNGLRYRWATPPGRHLTLPPVPAPLATLLRPAPAAPAAAVPVRSPDRYLRAVLAAHVGRILHAPRPATAGGLHTPGGRNDALNRAAYTLARLTDAGQTGEVRRALYEAALAAGLTDREAARTLASGWTAGQRRRP